MIQLSDFLTLLSYLFETVAIGMYFQIQSCEGEGNGIITYIQVLGILSELIVAFSIAYVVCKHLSLDQNSRSKVFQLSKTTPKF